MHVCMWRALEVTKPERVVCEHEDDGEEEEGVREMDEGEAAQVLHVDEVRENGERSEFKGEAVDEA